jgi:hypothetical protein
VNPRIAKEIGVLLPAFGLTLSASVLPLLWPGMGVFWMLILFSSGCLIMGALVFGNEFQHKTMSLLLIQPMARTAIWKQKMLVLGVALVIGAGVLCIGFELSEWQEFSRMDLGWMFFGLISLCAFCTTPWWTLLCRSTLLGAMGSLGPPIALLLLNGLANELMRTPRVEPFSGTALLIAYCVAAYWLGYRRFRTLQDLGPVSQELTIPARLESLLLRPFRRLSAGFTGAFGSLVKKELRLQQISFLGAGLFCLVVVAGTVLYQGHFTVGRSLDLGELILPQAFVIYMPLLPFMAGAVGVAEEKAWGVTDWQMTLPPSALTQWSTKMLVTLSTSLILGLVLPIALLLAASVLGLLDRDGSSAPLPMVLVLAAVMGHLLLTSVVVYAATLSSNTLRAIMLAFGLLFVAGCLIKIAAWIVFSDPDVVRFPGITLQIIKAFWGYRSPNGDQVTGLVCVEMLVFLCLIQRFAFTCYRNRGMTVFQRTIQALVLAFAVCILTVAFLILCGPSRY